MRAMIRWRTAAAGPTAARAVALAFALGSPTAATPAATPAFERTTLADGVSHLTVFALQADRTGFLWFGTMYGLVRFDGTSFRTFRSDPFDSTSLSYDDVVAIREDDAGDLWIGTWGGGASRYDRRAGKFVRFLPGGDDSTAISAGVVWAVAPAPDGTAWLGTDRGLDHVRADGRVLRRFRDSGNSGFRQSTVRALCLTHDGELWVGTFGSGLGRYDAARDGFMVGTPDDDPTAWDPGPRISCLLEDSAHRLWVGTQDRGLGVKLPGEAAFHAVDAAAGWAGTLTSATVQDLAEGPDGSIWAGTIAGLDRLDPDARMIRSFRPDIADPAALPAGNIACVAFDRSGGLWASSYQTGVVHLPPGPPPFPPVEPAAGTAAERNTLAFAETPDGTLWRATSAGLVARAKGGTERVWSPRPGVPLALPARPRALAADANGTLWVGTPVGLRRFDPARDRFVLPLAPRPSPADSGAVTVVLPARDGTLWVGLDGGLVRLGAPFDTARFVPDPAEPGSLPDGTVLSLAEDSRGRLWVGTYRGLARRDPGTDRFVRIAHDPRDPASLASDYVYSIHESGGVLWFGTAGGLDRLDEAAGTFTHFREREGLPSVVVGSIEEDDDGRLWLGTQRGLARFDPRTGRAEAFGPSDGLQGALFHPRASGRGRDGTLWFGGPGGYDAFHPGALPPPAPPPPLACTGFHAQGRATAPSGDASRIAALSLGPHENFFAFELAPLDFVRGPHVGIEHRLAGLDAGWIRTGPARTAAYTSVPPGRYTFEARAVGTDGSVGPVLAFPVTVRAPLWRTPAFLAAALTLLLASAWGAHRAAVRLRVRQAVAVDRARQDEREAVRRAAAADFHDELGHRVARIGLFAELLARGGAPPPEVGPTLQRIAREARRLADESRDFFWSLADDDRSAAGVIARLERFGGELFERTGVDFHVEAAGELSAVDLPAEARRHLLSLFKEAMTNALRHAGCREVVLRTGLDGERLTLELQDDGRGFVTRADLDGHGLANMQLRARRADATLTIASGPGAGTRVALTRRVVRPEEDGGVESLPSHPGRDRRG